MKIFKYVTMLLALIAMGTTFSSCSKDVDERNAKDVESKENFWYEFTLSNPGSLSATSQTKFNELFNLEIYDLEKKVDELTCNPVYLTEDEAQSNWNRLINLPNSENELITKVMKPVARLDHVRDFEVTVTFSKNEKETILGTKTWKASEVLTDEDIQ